MLNEDMLNINHAPTDEWAWGSEKIIWGYDKSHDYTYKILQPKKGKAGCLSLQYHNEKSESWFVHSGLAWGLFVTLFDNKAIIESKVLKPGDFIALPLGKIHRLMGLTDDVQVIEASTPDKHAADKTAIKDVIRLDCVLGRECSEPRNALEARIVAECRKITQKTIQESELNLNIKEVKIEVI